MRLRHDFTRDELSAFGSAASDLFEELSFKYSSFIEEHSLEIEDKVNFQLRSLERHEASQREMMNNVIQKHKDTLHQSRDMDVKQNP